MSIQASLVRRAVRASEFVRSEPTAENLAERRKGFDKVGRWTKPEKGTSITRTSIGGVAVDTIVNCAIPERTIVYAHGGGFVYGGNKAHLHMLSLLSRMAKARVHAIDYRLAPENMFPSAFDDVNTVLDKIDGDYALAGDSAGGNLALSVSIDRKIQGKSMPKSIVAIAPALDGTLSGDSIDYNASSDSLISRRKLEFFLDMYTGEQDREDPRISPLFADLSGLPPVLFQVSAAEALYSDSKLAHEKIEAAGGVSELYAPDNMWHVWHLMSRFVPESREAMQRVADFIVFNT